MANNQLLFLKHILTKEIAKIVNIAAIRMNQNKSPGETPGQVFSYEFCEIFKDTYFEEHLRATASDEYRKALR